MGYHQSFLPHPREATKACPWPSFAVVFHSKDAAKLAERLNQPLILPDKGGNWKQQKDSAGGKPSKDFSRRETATVQTEPLPLCI